jgi:hypothetical protein
VQGMGSAGHEATDTGPSVEESGGRLGGKLACGPLGADCHGPGPNGIVMSLI